MSNDPEMQDTSYDEDGSNEGELRTTSSLRRLRKKNPKSPKRLLSKRSPKKRRPLSVVARLTSVLLNWRVKQPMRNAALRKRRGAC